MRFLLTDNFISFPMQLSLNVSSLTFLSFYLFYYIFVFVCCIFSFYLKSYYCCWCSFTEWWQNCELFSCNTYCATTEICVFIWLYVHLWYFLFLEKDSLLSSICLQYRECIFLSLYVLTYGWSSLHVLLIKKSRKMR